LEKIFFLAPQNAQKFRLRRKMDEIGGFIATKPKKLSQTTLKI